MTLLAVGSTDLGPALTQIGIGALVAAPAFGMLRVIWQKSENLSAEISKLREDQITRERELSDKTVPVLGECVRVLTAVARATEEETMTRRIRAQIADEKK